MISKAIIYLCLTLISLFPMVIWAYIFSYIDENPINKKRFIIGLFWWWLSVFPILYMDKILEYLNIGYLNIFNFISKISNILSSIEFSFSLILFFLLLVSITFIFWFPVHLFKKIFKIYFKNIIIFIFFIVLLSFFVFLLNFVVSWFDFIVPYENTVYFWSIIFNTFKLIIFYYLLVAFIEETSKHFNFLQSSYIEINSIKSWVLYAIFVALGFSLIENVLYLYNYYSLYWVWVWLLKIYFLRSMFSVIVHILCSSIVAYYFSKAYLLYKDKILSYPYVKIFFTWVFISIVLHLIFDVSLTLWFSLIMFIYFIWWYLYVSSIFYSE